MASNRTSLKRGRGFDDNDDEESRSVHYYIAQTGGQEWGRHPGEAGTGEDAIQIIMPDTTLTTNRDTNRTVNQNYLNYWRTVYNTRVNSGRPARLNLDPVTDLERAVLGANFASEAAMRIDTTSRSAHEAAVASFQDIAARARAAQARMLVPRPAIMPGRRHAVPPNLPRPASRPRLEGGIVSFAQEREEQRTMNDLSISLAGLGTGADEPPSDEDDDAGGVEAELGPQINPGEARARFGRALRKRNLSAHKRSKYTKIYNFLSKFC